MPKTNRPFPRKLEIDGFTFHAQRFLPPRLPYITVRIPAGRDPSEINNFDAFYQWQEAIMRHWLELGGSPRLIEEHNRKIAAQKHPLQPG